MGRQTNRTIGNEKNLFKDQPDHQRTFAKLKMTLFVLLILTVFASEKMTNEVENEEKYGNTEENSILVKIEEDDYDKVNKSSKFIGVTYHKKISKWLVQRKSKNENKNVYNGCYDDEETAAHASDTLARKIMKNGEQN